MALSWDGKLLASGEDKRKIVVFDTENGNQLLDLTLEKSSLSVRCVAFSPDSKRLGACEGVRAVWWNIENGQKTIAINQLAGFADRMEFSPDGMQLAVVGERVEILDANTGERLYDLIGHAGRVHDLAFSSDGKRITTVTQDGTIKIWDLTTGLEISTLVDVSSSKNVLLSPDGKWFASQSGEPSMSSLPMLRVWDLTLENK